MSFIKKLLLILLSISFLSLLKTDQIVKPKIDKVKVFPPVLSTIDYSIQSNNNLRLAKIDIPIISDVDKTPLDIGAIPAESHGYDVWELPDAEEDNGWEWNCFPVIDNRTSGNDVIYSNFEQFIDSGDLAYISQFEINIALLKGPQIQALHQLCYEIK